MDSDNSKQVTNGMEVGLSSATKGAFVPRCMIKADLKAQVQNVQQQGLGRAPDGRVARHEAQQGVVTNIICDATA